MNILKKTIKWKFTSILLSLILIQIISYVTILNQNKKKNELLEFKNLIEKNRYLSQRIMAFGVGSFSKNEKTNNLSRLILKSELVKIQKNLNIIELKYGLFLSNSFKSLNNFKEIYLKNRKLLYSINTKMSTHQEEIVHMELVNRLQKGIMLDRASDILKDIEKNTKKESNSFYFLLVTISILNLVFIFSIFLVLNNLIIDPLQKIKSISLQFSKGKFSNKIVINNINDEIGQISQSINNLIDNINKASNFANCIGRNELESNLIPLSDEDILGHSLLTMRNNLKDFSNKEAKRRWINEGLAKFTEIIRSTEDIEKFYNNVLSNLVRYVNANQGYLYILSDTNDEPYLEIKAVYAYGKQKYLENKKIIKFKEGLVGQAWFDKESLYFTEIPKDYVNITSGIGEATPTSIFIIPLIVNEKVQGAIELASFSEIEEHEKEFLNKISESIASTISTVKINERTQVLLLQAQEQAEVMKSQEEEMRQNMEELTAIQEEMSKNERLLKSRISLLEKELENK
jgi:HAMP domain-containing protein